MPSIAPAGALLSLFNPDNWDNDLGSEDSDDSDGEEEEDTDTPAKNSSPFFWPAFQAQTGIMRPIFSPTPLPETPQVWKSEEDNAAVWSFVRKFWSLPKTQKVTFISRKTKDNNTLGRVLFLDWLKAEYSGWGVSQIILSSLSECGVDPYSTIKLLDGSQTKLPNYEQSQAYLAYPTMADALFGPEAFHSAGHRILKQPVQQCLHELALAYWHTQEAKFKREWTKLESLKKAAEDGWNDLSHRSEQKKKLTMEDFRAWLKHVTSLTAILKRHGDKESINALKDQRARLQEMLFAMGMGDGSKRGQKFLPKPLRQALSLLASQKQVDLLSLSLRDELAVSNPIGERHGSDELSMLDHDLKFDRVPDIDWSEGVEEYQKFSTKELWTMLGRLDQTVPFFNAKQDPDGRHNSWSDDGAKWLQAPSNGVPLNLRWHQIVGVLKMIENAFSGKPVLLMDGVGLGKTIQVSAYIAMLSWYRDHFEIHGKFPGNFAERKWDTPDGNIPDYPSLLVVPPGLVDQVTDELHVYFEHGRFDILPLLGTWAKRQDWWSDHFTKCKNRLGRRIVMTTPKASLSDFDSVLEADKSNPTAPPKPHASFARDGPKTLYGQDFLVTVVDEAHQYRILNKAYFACFALMERSRSRVLLTATPIISSPKDVWNLGRLLHIESFISETANGEYQKMDSKLRQSMAKDRKQLKMSGNMEALVKTTVNGGPEVTPSMYAKEMRKAVDTIRIRYAGVIIRRTLQSVDHTGCQISGLEPYREYFIEVSLYPKEMENLDKLAQELVKEGTHKVAQVTGGTDFYLKIRRALIHPSCNPGYPWHDPSTLEEWHKDPSAKLDNLVEIVKWHHAEDNQPALKTVKNKLKPSKRPQSSSRAKSAGPDKMIIYCEFPPAFVQIRQILLLHGIEVLELDGNKSSSQRAEIIRAFKASTRGGPRVLLMSRVGLVGLNLPCANILIQVTHNWSVHDDGQLIGRIYRYPQSKTVLIYHLIAANTQDVFLNHLAISKGAVTEAFTNTTPSMRTLFNIEGGMAEDDDQEPDSGGDLDDRSSKTKKRKREPEEKGGKASTAGKRDGGDESEKPKTKKRQHREDEEVQSGAGDHGGPVKKRKHKGKADVYVDGNSEVPTGDLDDRSSKTKKRKQEPEGKEGKASTAEKKDGGDESEKPKTKKRKHREDNDEEVQSGAGDRDGPVKKSKQKGKVDVCVDSNSEVPAGGGGDESKTPRTKRRKHNEEEMQTLEEDGDDPSGKKQKKDKVGTQSRDGDEKSGSERGAPKETKTKKRKMHSDGGDNENAEPAVEKKSKSKKSNQLKQVITPIPGGDRKTFSLETLLNEPEFSDLANKIVKKK